MSIFTIASKVLRKTYRQLKGPQKKRKGLAIELENHQLEVKLKFKLKKANEELT